MADPPAIGHTDSRVLHLLLAHHLADSAPGPSIPRWEREANRGLTDRDWQTCPTCHGTGIVNTRRGERPCGNARCQGEGGWYGDNYDSTHARIHAEHADELDPLTYALTLLDWSGQAGNAAWRLCRATHARRGAIPDPGDYLTVVGPQNAPESLTEDLQPNTYERPFLKAVDATRDHRPDLYLAFIRVHRLNSLPHEWHPSLQDDYRDGLTHLARLLGPRFRAPRWVRVAAATERKGTNYLTHLKLGVTLT